MLRIARLGVVALILCPQVFALDDVEIEKRSARQQFWMDPFKKSDGHIPVFYSGLCGIYSRFGQPENTEKNQFPDRTSDALMTSHMLLYDGLTFGVVESEDKNHSWVETIILYGDAHELKYSISIGSTYDEIALIFDVPPPGYRPKGTTLNLYGEIRGYWASYKDELGQPKRVYANIDVRFEFDAEDHVEKVVLSSYGD